MEIIIYKFKKEFKVIIMQFPSKDHFLILKFTLKKLILMKLQLKIIRN